MVLESSKTLLSRSFEILGEREKRKKKKGNVTKIMKIVNYEREKETSSKFLIALEQFVIIKVFAV